MKKLMMGLIVFSSLTFFTGCTQEEKTADTQTSTTVDEENPLAGITEKDVVSEEEVEVDGEKYVKKTLKDGTVVSLPPGMTLDDLKKQQANGDDGNLSVYSEDETDEKE